MKGFSFLISLGCSPFCREPANRHNRQRECQRLLNKIFDGQVLNEDDKHELECLAGQDPLIVQQIHEAELRLRREGNARAADDLLMIRDRVTLGEMVIREDAPHLELMNRDIEEGRSIPSRQTPPQRRHRGGPLLGTTYSRDNQTITRQQETESRSVAQEPQRATSGLSSAFPYSSGFPIGNLNIQGSRPGQGGSNLPVVQSPSTSSRGAGLNLPSLHSSGSNIPSSAFGRETRLLMPGRQRGGPNSPASGSSQAPVTPRGAGTAQTRGTGTSPSGNQAPRQAESRLRNQGRTGPQAKS